MNLLAFFRNPLCPIARNRRRRGITLIESAVALASFSGVTAFTVSLMMISAKQSRRAVDTLPADMQSFRMTDQVREKAFSAQGGRYQLEDNGTAVVFNNPSLGLSAQSRLFFNGDSLFYTDTTTSSTSKLATLRKMTDGSFSIEPDGRSIRVTMNYETKNSQNQVVMASREEIIRARN